jgi:Domain of unknown function (DUF4865)
MHAMQYRIVLPSDYDMNIIRARVATKGAALDNFVDVGADVDVDVSSGPGRRTRNESLLVAGPTLSSEPRR